MAFPVANFRASRVKLPVVTMMPWSAFSAVIRPNISRTTGAPTENTFHCFHATFRTPAKGVIDLIAFSAIRLGNEVFEVFPRSISQGFQIGLLVEEATAFRGEQERAEGKYAEQQQGERSQGNNPFGEQLAGAILSGPHGKAPANPGKSRNAKAHAAHHGSFRKSSLKDSLWRRISEK